MAVDHDRIIEPYGGVLVDTIVPAEELPDVQAYAARLPAVRIGPRSECDLELLAVGACSPLAAFMGRVDLEAVLEQMRLADGRLFPMPLVLPVDAETARYLDHDVALVNERGDRLAVMTVQEVHAWDRRRMAQVLAGTADAAHPLVAEMAAWGPLAASGRLRVLRTPVHHEFQALRLTPRQTRARLGEIGCRRAVAWPTSLPLDRADEEFARRAVRSVDGVLLLQQIVGVTRPGEASPYTSVRACRVLIDRCWTPDEAALTVLPVATRLAGVRDAIWQAIMARNHGAGHLVVGHDRAGASTGDAKDDEARGADLAAETAVVTMAYREFVFLPDEQRFEDPDRVDPDLRTLSISRAQVRDRYLASGRALPAWHTRPEVAAVLAEAHRPRHRQGVCVWFTGLSGAGKSTVAEILAGLLVERGRSVTTLDGDQVRMHLSSGLGFSREDRDANIRRIGFVAAEIVRHGGVVLCAAVSPYRATREEVRRTVGEGRFIEVFVDTPLDLCEQRDVKGLYARARRGEIPRFTGIDDPYEPPLQPEVVLRTEQARPVDHARLLLDLLRERGFLPPQDSSLGLEPAGCGG